MLFSAFLKWPASPNIPVGFTEDSFNPFSSHAKDQSSAMLPKPNSEIAVGIHPPTPLHPTQANRTSGCSSGSPNRRTLRPHPRSAGGFRVLERIAPARWALRTPFGHWLTIRPRHDTFIRPPVHLIFTPIQSKGICSIDRIVARVEVQVGFGKGLEQGFSDTTGIAVPGEVLRVLRVLIEFCIVSPEFPHRNSRNSIVLISFILHGICFAVPLLERLRIG